MSAPKLLASCRIRTTPYTPRVEGLGVSGYTIVNHTILPKGFQRSVVDDYWHLKTDVQLWDVGCQRQVELSGPDAAQLAQLMTPRDLSNAVIGQCLYAPVVDEQGAMLNDPIIMKLAADRFWLSIADSDLMLWAKGLAHGMGLKLDITEPDVWPMAIQGPKSDDLMALVFGEAVRDIRFFRFSYLKFRGHPLLIARSGYSKQGGFEIYLDRPELALDLWDALWEAGQAFNVAPGSPNLIERIEGGLLSYGNEMSLATNALECGLGAYCQLDGSIDYIGRAALQSIAEKGPQRQIRGLVFDGEPCPPCQRPWPVKLGADLIGQVTSAIWSPSFNNNVALAMIDRACWTPGTKVAVEAEDGSLRQAVVVALPFPEPASVFV